MKLPKALKKELDEIPPEGLKELKKLLDQEKKRRSKTKKKK